MSIISDSYSAVKYYKYDEYGKITTLGSSSFINSETYTGAISEGSNIYYMNARFYNANTGRFLTQDTYKGNAYEPWSQNLYTYVGNNPINYIDPTGHRRQDDDPIVANKARWDDYLSVKEYIYAHYGDDADLYRKLANNWEEYQEELEILEEQKRVLTDQLNEIIDNTNEWFDIQEDRTIADNFIDYGSVLLAILAEGQSPDLNVDALIGLDNTVLGLIKLDLERLGTNGEIWWVDMHILGVSIENFIVERRITKLYKEYNEWE